MEANECNRVIFSAWDLPTTYTLGGVTVNGARAKVETTYFWGPETQYPVDSRLVTIWLTRENGRWYVEDLRDRDGRDGNETSVYHALVKNG
jgi:hypothetical protein